MQKHLAEKQKTSYTARQNIFKLLISSGALADGKYMEETKLQDKWSLKIEKLWGIMCI